MSAHLPPSLEDASPSTRHVWLWIAKSDAPVSVAELRTTTGYSYETIRVAASDLEDAGLVESDYGTEGDARERHFETAKNHR